MKEWKCVRVDRHADVGNMIEEFQKKEWQLHTYRPLHVGTGTDVDHFLLFHKGK